MDPATLRADGRACGEVVYLDTGACGPGPRRVVDASGRAQAYHEYDSPGAEGTYEYAFGLYDDVRARVADALHAGEYDVALTSSTTDGIGRVAAAVDRSPGDVVVRTDLEHPGGILPWERLERHVGVEARVVEAVGLDTVSEHNGRPVDRLKAGLDDHRLVSPREFESGLVAFEVDDPVATVERLADEGIRIRPLPHPDAVRASLHVFDTAVDVDALLDAL